MTVLFVGPRMFVGSVHMGNIARNIQYKPGFLYMLWLVTSSADRMKAHLSSSRLLVDEREEEFSSFQYRDCTRRSDSPS
jgi:hypothetical protein